VVKPLAVPPDAEHVVIDYLSPALLARGQDVTCGVNIPTTWNPLPTTQGGTKPHVQVALDGTPEITYPIRWRTTIRLTAWASTTSAAKALAALAHGLMLQHPGSPEVGSVRPLTGTLPTRDPVTGAQLASVTVQVNLTGTVLV
jgi:hypothetical protein